MAGLDPVTFDPALSAIAQEDALLIAANWDLNHFPDSSSRCYTANAAAAAGRSNLALGAGGAKAIDLYVSDNGIDSLGHRRWVLYPPTLTMGSGSTAASNTLVTFGSPTAPAGTFSNPAWVPWPTAGYFPTQLEPFGKWSLTAPGSGYNFSAASVTVIGPSGQPISVVPKAADPGYGNDTLTWDMGTVARVNGADTAVYRVSVNGIKDSSGATRNYSYQVKLYDPTAWLVSGTAPTTVDTCGTYADTFTIPSTPHVDYRVGGVAKPAGTYLTNGAASVTVTASPQGDYLLIGTASWTLHFDTALCSFASTPTPTVSGRPVTGAMLTGTAGVWTPTPGTITYQWNRVTGGVSTPIPGATGASYTPMDADIGSTLTVSVTGTRDGYAATTKTSAATRVVTAPIPGTFVALSPARLLDTRTGAGAPVAPVAGGGTVRLQVTDRGGVPASGVAAVVLNVTVTNTSTPGYITAYPTGSTRPLASNLNFVDGTTIPNLVTVKLGSNGQVDLFNGASGKVDLVADIAGYYVAGTPTVPGAFVALPPSRLLDTRTGNGAPVAPVGTGGAVTLQVGGRGGVPTSGVAAVVLNVTATNTTGTGYVTVYPTGSPRPLASNLNFAAGTTIPNLVTVKLGGNGKVTLYNGAPGTADLVADIAGYYLAGTPTALGAFVSLAPARILDTRSGNGAPLSPVAADGTVTLQVTGRGGVPTTAVDSVIVNVTATNTRTGGFVTAYPTGDARPLASNLNYSTGVTIPNLVAVKLGSNGKVSLYNGSPGTTDLVADIAGYFLN